MNSTDRLTEELRRQAQGIGDQHPLSLADVQGRARGIRRRRYAASGLAAVAVLAVTVPLGIAAGDHLDRTSTGPVDRPGEGRTVIDEDGTPAPDPTPTPLPFPRRVVLTSDVEPGGPAAVAYLSGGDAHLPDGTTVDVEDDADTLALLGTGLVLGGDSGGGQRYTAYVSASGDVVWSEPAASGPVLSPTGRLVAFGRPDGRTVTVEEDGTRETLTTVPDPADGYQVAAVLDDSGTCRGVGESCTVWLDSRMSVAALSQTTRDRGGETPQRFERTDDLPALVQAVSVTGDLALVVSIDGAGGACSEVAGADGTRVFRTCDWKLGAFSPDGRFVLGYPLEDGEGSRSVALLDTRTGEPVVTYAVEGRTDVFVRQVVWEDAGSALATVWDTDHWSVLRVAVDGSLTSVAADGLDGAGRDTAPVVLALQP